MNGWLVLISLFLLQAVVVLAAALIWRDRMARWVAQRLRLETAEPSPRDYAENLAGAYQRLAWLKHHAATGDAKLHDPAPYDEGMICLRRSAEYFRDRPEASAHLGQGLMRVSELMIQALERQVAAAQATDLATGEDTDSDATPDAEPTAVDPQGISADAHTPADALAAEATAPVSGGKDEDDELEDDEAGDAVEAESAATPETAGAAEMPPQGTGKGMLADLEASGENLDQTEILDPPAERGEASKPADAKSTS
jgi:hypothetical protein